MAKGKYDRWLTDEGLAQIGGWKIRGLTDEEVAANMGVSYSTLRAWRDKYPALSAVLKKSKEAAELTVENALFRKAIGYDYDEETKELRFDKASKAYRMVTTKTVRKHQPPDTAAAIFFLKNRAPDRWKDKQDVSVSTGMAEEQSRLAELLNQRREKRGDD